jgi:hypothetical protein
VKWDHAGLDRYLKHRDLIDTVLVPVIKVNMGMKADQYVNQAFWVLGVAAQIEEQLAGRIVLLPTVTYTGSHDWNALQLFLNQYAIDLGQSVANVVFITADHGLKNGANDLNAQLIHIELTEQNAAQPSTQELFECAQKYIPRLIRLWQKG